MCEYNTNLRFFGGNKVYMFEVSFKNKKLREQNLLPFGFILKEECYEYTADLVDGLFRMTIFLYLDGKIATKVIDTDSQEEYVLHHVPGAGGAFVGRVKAEYEAILNSVAENCFETDVFKSEYARKVIAYVRETYHDELEFLWKKFSDNAVFRRKDTNKWYCVLLVLPKEKLGIDSDERVEIIDLKIKPEEVDSTIDGKKYFPGYHMNKKHWYTICLDGSVPIEEIYKRIDDSYNLVRK